ncbi:ArsC family reductase [Rosenbergiella australiborealis]|uniref:ArsC family reductase n=1 Tax=Rosenbergiella australiborealis TaxID=1544696 RepID=A0ABS5T6C7_9GAMM|nr:ArsC family reductase [Rosenbergiella australiborealis]MBT0727662.1 ArsC family reductase [Rosenbergiella australiborealis]
MTQETAPTLILYGIKTCDTVRKARKYLSDNHIDVTFHDFRQQGIDSHLLEQFIEGLGLKALLNTRGTTWRNLTDEEKQSTADPLAARNIMLKHPAVIKRPVLVRADGKMLVGFDTETWSTFLQGAN